MTRNTAETTKGNQMDDKADRLRLQLTFGVAVVGILSVMIAFLVSVIVFKNSKAPGELIPAVLGTITAAIGTLAGLVAGHAAGAAGKERAEWRADSREQEAAAGRTLAEAIKAGEAALPEAGDEGDEGFEAVTPAEGVNAAYVVRQQAELANRLFP
jgi:hypothetical protein